MWFSTHPKLASISDKPKPSFDWRAELDQLIRRARKEGIPRWELRAELRAHSDFLGFGKVSNRGRAVALACGVSSIISPATKRPIGRKGYSK